jgi:hypothetical protein
MTIYILDEDPKLCVQALDDESLDKMIKDIAQVLCNIHWEIYWHEGKEVYGDRQLPSMKYLLAEKSKTIHEWAEWARECKSNYIFLIDLLCSLLSELTYRIYLPLDDKHNNLWWKYGDIARWMRDNMPNLPLYKELPSDGSRSQLPLVMPKKYSEHTPANRRSNKLKIQDKFELYHAYRNYYKAKLRQLKFTATKQAARNVVNNTGKSNTVTFPRWTKRKKPEWLAL